MRLSRPIREICDIVDKTWVYLHIDFDGSITPTSLFPRSSEQKNAHLSATRFLSLLLTTATKYTQQSLFRSATMNTSSSCSGYLSSPSPSLNNSYCAMPNCASNLAAMKTCCKNAAVVSYIMPPPSDPYSGSNSTYNPNLNGIYCLIGNETFADWSNCTSAQNVEAGICATGVEAYQSGAGRQEVGSLMGLIALLLLVRNMV